LKKFQVYDCKPIATPLVVNEKLQKNDGRQQADASRYRSLIGSLLYLTTTWPDIMYDTSLLSRFMQKPSQIDYGVRTGILRYLQGTKEFGIWYKTMINSRMIGYTDSDWAGSIDEMRSFKLHDFTSIISKLTFIGFNISIFKLEGIRIWSLKISSKGILFESI